MLKSGQLQYYSEAKPMKGWKDVDASLKGTIFTFQTSEKPDAKVHNVDLTEASAIEASEDDSNVFIIEQDVRLQFDCPSHEDMESWVSALQSAAKGHDGNTVSMDDFLSLKTIGKGNFAKVDLVMHKPTHQLYAMKIMSKQNVAQEGNVSKLFDERQILLSIHHRFLVSAHYAFQTSAKVCLVTDFIQGGELKTLIEKQHPIPTRRVQMYAAQLCEAIGYLHSKNIIHRDLKSENVLIDQNGDLKVTDFGLAKNNMPNTKDATTNTFCGTPNYMAPEIVEGGKYNQTVDWWSLGIILYQMTFGTSPFDDPNDGKVYRKILQEDPEYPGMDEPEKLGGFTNLQRAFIDSLLNKDQETRLGSQGDYLEIEQHPFFNGFDFEALRRGDYENEWKPELKDPVDLSMFNTPNAQPAFTPEMSLDAETQKQFIGFTWEAK